MTIGTVKIPDTYSELYPDRFLKADLLKDKPRTLTIDKVIVEVMPDDKSGGEKERGIVSFKETKRQLALNRTNGECIKAMFGKKVSSWIGKPITLVPEVAKFGKDDVDAIRISGSPLLKDSIELEIKMPKRKPVKRRLVNTGKASPQSAQSDPVDAPVDIPVVQETQEQVEEKKTEEVSE